MTTELDDTFDTVNRLEEKRDVPPLPLAHLADRQRDGPREGHGPYRCLGRTTAQTRPSQRISEFSYHSKGKS